MKLGDLFPRLRELPGYEALAEREAEPGTPDVAPSPSVPAMARSFLGAMRAWVRDGGRLADRPARAARRATCFACPHHDGLADACRLCGCGGVVPGGLAAKRAIAAGTCPDDPPRWGPA